jgi:hypothetical protein
LSPVQVTWQLSMFVLHSTEPSTQAFAPVHRMVHFVAIVQSTPILQALSPMVQLT